MISSKTIEYYQRYYGVYLSDYIGNKNSQDTRLNYILAFIIICILLGALCISKPIFAKTDTIEQIQTVQTEQTAVEVYPQEKFENYIKQKYQTNYVSFPTNGIAHIKKVKYINSKPIKINIVELNTRVNPYLKIKPQIASSKLNSKTTVRKIAQRQKAIVAINGGFFKPQTGVPLGALMIDRRVLTGPIYNRVGMAIFEEGNKTSFKMDNIVFDINAYTKNHTLKIDNINQPRMLSTHVLLYTSDWGTQSPVAPSHCYNILIQGNKVVKVSANPIILEQDDIVIQGSKEKMLELVRDKEIYIKLKLQDGLKDAKHIIGAGPYLVKDSQIYVDVKTQKLQAIGGKNPRSAIGYKKDGTFIIVTVDGREQSSVGMTLFELATLMKNLGCEYAMNFDGGSSSAMYVKGNIVNTAINKEGIPVSNALVVSEFAPNELVLSGV